MASVGTRHGRIRRIVGLLVACVFSVAASPSDKSDPLCPHLVPCEYEAPAFTIRVVDEQTGQPLEGVHAIASWIVYGGPRRRAPIVMMESISDREGRLAFPSWGPIRSSVEGVLPRRDPMVHLFRPGYRTRLIHNANIVRLDNARVRSFHQDGETFTMIPFQGTFAEALVDLRRARDPLEGSTVSDYDPAGFKLVYISRLERVKAEVMRLPQQEREVKQLLWGIDGDIRSFEARGQR